MSPITVKQPGALLEHLSSWRYALTEGHHCLFGTGENYQELAANLTYNDAQKFEIWRNKAVEMCVNPRPVSLLVVSRSNSSMGPLMLKSNTLPD